MRNRIMNYALVIVGVYALLLLWLRWNEPRMIYYPTRDIEMTPVALGLKYEDVHLTAADGVRINGWLLPAPTTQQSSPITVLFLHGNAGNISHRLDKLAILHELGATVFIIDYRGYGRSEGSPNETGTYLDAQVAYEHLTKTTSLKPGMVILYGESLGAAVAIDLASKVATGGVVIEEAFTSTADIGQKMFPIVPVRWLVRNKYDSLGKIGRINAPLLILHSRDDEMIPVHHAERLLAAARPPKQFVELRGSHNDAFLVSADKYRSALRDFFASLQ